MAGKRSHRLSNAFDVSIYLSKVINRLERDEITESKAGKIAYICNMIMKAFELSDLDKRLKTLEQGVNKS